MAVLGKEITQEGGMKRTDNPSWSRPNKKAAKRIEERIKTYEKDLKLWQLNHQGDGFHKPGSARR